MARILELRDYDRLNMALTKAICCSFLLTLMDENTLSLPSAPFDADILEESRDAVREWQCTELHTMQTILEKLRSNSPARPLQTHGHS